MALKSPFVLDPATPSPPELAQLIDAHGAALELYATQWTTAPEDCVQEAFVELIRQKQRPENPTAWLYRVVRNKALNAARAKRRRTSHEEVAGRLRADDQSANHLDKLDVAQAVTQLEDLPREIVTLRLWSGLSWREIADLTETPASTVQRRYAEALSTLQNFFEVRSVTPRSAW
ncbi:MAG: sigma-70 family RNA polymerase sigma factor [Lacipirellulaceae bacterium]